ncbi:MAG: thioredoxin fold domain-containing protein [Gammaproteobacteria bacterium]|nr:thioredoxin fold domain-containing protein [Gammaproteobacteria bacterium]
MATIRLSLPLAVLCCLLGSASLDSEVHFHDLGFDEALERAEAEAKVVFIDFFTTWCVPCKEMDATTFKDSDVSAWLAEHTVALKIDAEASETNRALAQRYGVRSFPNYVFISPNGDLMDRITGKRPPEEFIEHSNSALRGENAIARAQAALAAGNPEDPSLRSRLADAYAELGQDQNALREYLWCFDVGMKNTESYGAVRLSFLLSDIERLGRRYPPARAALVERRRQAEQRIIDGSAEYDDIADYSSINETLDEQDATLALYDRVRDAGSLPDLTMRAFAREVFDLLVDAKRYERIVAEYDVSARIEWEFESFRSLMEFYQDPGEMFDQVEEQLSESTRKELADILADSDHQERMRQTYKDMLRDDIASHYQVLVGAGLLEDAAEVAQRLIEELDDAETHNALAWAGYLTGSPVEANLVQARRAFEMTEGKDIAIVDTLARVLATLGHKDEAVSIGEKALLEAETSSDRQVLLYCLEYCYNYSAD